MTSRKRVLMALNHQEPDWIPIDLGGSFVTGIAAAGLHRLRKRLGLEDRPVKVYDLFQMLGEMDMGLVERMQLDPVHNIQCNPLRRTSSPHMRRRWRLDGIRSGWPEAAAEGYCERGRGRGGICSGVLP